MRTRSSRTTVVYVLAAAALIGAACGDDDDSASSSEPAAGASTPAAGGTQPATSGSAAEPAASAPAAGGSAPAASGSELVVWADNSANTAKAIEPLCQAWAEANGVTCRVQKFNGGGELEDALVAGNATGDVPDVFEGPHNGIGEYVRNGILAPIDLGSKAGSFQEEAVKGVTWDGSTYGVPWAVENVAMMTNTDLSPTCPATLDEAVANAKALKDAGTTTLGIALQIGETGDAYHWYPLYSADGGYTFARNDDGSYNVDDMGVGKEGSIAAGNRLQQLANEGVVQSSVSYDIARETFAAGGAPYFITGPWQIPEQKEALGDKLMICPVPNWEGSQYESQPFLGVRTFMQPAKAPNPLLASTFLNDAVMTTEFMDDMYSVDPRPPAWLESYEKAAADPIIEGFGSYGKAGIPMPAVPQMANVFADLGLAQYKITTGEDPTSVLTQAGESINNANAALD